MARKKSSAKRKDPPAPGKGGAKPKRVRRTCSVEGCTTQARRGGVCALHGAKVKKCSHPGCTKNALKKGVCTSHGAKRSGRKQCKVEGCTNNAKKEGRCRQHGAEGKKCSVKDCTKYAQKGGVCIRHGAEVKRCSVEDCNNEAKKGGVCILHGAEVKKCSVPECDKYPRKGGLCKRHYKTRQQAAGSEDGGDGDGVPGGQGTRAAKRRRRSTEARMEVAPSEGWGEQGELRCQQAQPRQQVEQIALHRVVHEQPAPADFDEMAVAHDPYDEVINNEGTIELNGDNGKEAESAPMAPGLPPLQPPVIEDAGAMDEQAAYVFDKYDGDKVDMTQDNGNEDCIEPEPSKKGVEYVLKVAEKVVEVKREQIEETKEAKVAAETRAAAAEEVAMEARRALEAATKTKKLTNRVRDHQLCSLGNLPRGEIETRLLEILLRSGAGNDEEASEAFQGECMVCCEPYEAEAHRSRVVCSAEDGCGTFAMCRLCVFRSSIILEDPVQIDNEATYGAFDYDTSVCPQCRKEGAFQENELPALPDDVKRAVEAEIWEGRDREQIAAAQHAFEDGNDEDDGDYEPQEHVEDGSDEDEEAENHGR